MLRDLELMAVSGCLTSQEYSLTLTLIIRLAMLMPISTHSSVMLSNLSQLMGDLLSLPLFNSTAPRLCFRRHKALFASSLPISCIHVFHVFPSFQTNGVICWRSWKIRVTLYLRLSCLPQRGS